MSKDTHGFSVSVACEVGVPGAILLQHLCFLQKEFETNETHWQQTWVRRSAKNIAKIYPYWSGKQISGAMDNLEKGGFVLSKIENGSKYDRSKSFILTEKALSILGECIFQTANGLAETENLDLPNGEMTIKVGCNSFVTSFNKENAGASDPLSPPFTKTGEIELPETIFPLEAEKEMPPPVPPAPPSKYDFITCPACGGAGWRFGRNGKEPCPECYGSRTAIRLTIADPEPPGVEVHEELPAPKTQPVASGRTPKTRKGSQTLEEIDFAQTVLDEINRLKGGRPFKINEGDNIKGIIERRRDGATYEEMKAVLAEKWSEWGGNAEWQRCFNPVTLFRKCNFYNYLTAAVDRATIPAKPKQPTLNGNRSTLNGYGGNSEKYNEKQIF